MAILAEPFYPFRWDVAHPSQLGRLPFNVPGFVSQYEWFAADFNEQIRNLSVKVLAFADNADLYFVGRSPENIYDYLRGILNDTPWAERLHLFHFSMYYESERVIKSKFPGAIAQLRAYMTDLGLAPWQILKRKRPVAFVDLICSGGTLGRLIRLILNWGKELDLDTKRLASKIRVVGIIREDVPNRITNPHPTSWKKDSEWTRLLGKDAIKNISLEPHFWSYLGDSEPKLSQSFFPARWNDSRVKRPDHSEKRRQAMRISLKLFCSGLNKAERGRFAGQMGQKRAMRFRWFRQLLNRLN